MERTSPCFALVLLKGNCFSLGDVASFEAPDPTVVERCFAAIFPV